MQSFVAGTSSSPLVLLPGLFVLVLSIAGLTLLYTVILTLDSDRKKQGIAAVLLFAGMLLFFTLPLSVPGIPRMMEYLLVPLAALSLVPLSAIIPGVLWFWPGRRRETVKTTILCVVATVAAVVLICRVPAIFVSPSPVFIPLYLLLTAADGVPMGISLVYLAVFLASSAIACIVYILMRIAGSRELPGWLAGWVSVNGQKKDP